MAGDETGIPIPPLSNDAPGLPIPLADPDAKKKRHRRTKAEIEAERKKTAAAPAAGPDPEDLKRATAALSMTFKAAGAVVASKRGEHWRLEDKECDTLGGVWAAVLAPYLPRVAAASPVIFALATTWMVIQPRVEADTREAARRKLEKGPELAP